MDSQKYLFVGTRGPGTAKPQKSCGRMRCNIYRQTTSPSWQSLFIPQYQVYKARIWCSSLTLQDVPPPSIYLVRSRTKIPSPFQALDAGWGMDPSALYSIALALSGNTTSH
ncbi:hypothetical protein GGR53DRAFT_181819 [Hypoxylon sp. FL1150]|nr:hypothetical protein GGR53DRAFT_181819 [Hypoxylon sp. FL1150]